jgi:hypothetical protein
LRASTSYLISLCAMSFLSLFLALDLGQDV